MSRRTARHTSSTAADAPITAESEHAPRTARERVLGRIICTVATFHAVCFAWIFFRSETLGHARLMLHQLTRFSTHHDNLPAPVLTVLAVALVSHSVAELSLASTDPRQIRSPVFVQGILLFGVAWVLRSMSGADSVPFVYFQF